MTRLALRSLGVMTLLSAFLLGLPVTAQDSWRLVGLEGGALVPADLTSQDTVVIVWAGWSPRCREISRQTQEIRSQVGERARVISVNFQEDEADIRSFLGDRSFPVPIYLDRDGTFSRQHRVTALPGWVIYREGKVVEQGKLPSDPESVLQTALP